MFSSLPEPPRPHDARRCQALLRSVGMGGHGHGPLGRALLLGFNPGLRHWVSTQGLCQREPDTPKFVEELELLRLTRLQSRVGL